MKSDDVDDLVSLRAFRAEIAMPPDGLQARLEEALMQHVLIEEANLRGRRPSRWHRWNGISLARGGAGFAAVVACFVVAVNVAAPSPADSVQAHIASGSTTSAGVASGGASAVLDAAASRLLGREHAGGQEHQAPPLMQRQLTADQLDTYPVVPTAVGEPSLLAAGPASMSGDQMAQVPTDPRTLLTTMRRAVSGDYDRDVDFGTFRVAAYYLADPDVPVQLRAAVLRMLALTEGVGIGAAAVDVFGRQGIVVARLDASSGIRQQYLIDPEYGSLLEHLEFMTRPDADRPDECPAGTVVALGVYDGRGFRVTPDSAPYARWPQVVTDCD